MSKFVTKEEAARMIRDESTVCSTGFVASSVPETVLAAIEDRFLAEGHPRNTTFVAEGGFGDHKTRGQDHFGHDGMTRRYINAHYGMAPKMQKLIHENKVEAYSFPQGVLSQLVRATAARKPGVFTKVGLGTYVDPRIEGGKMNAVTKEDLVRIVELDGEEWMFYKALRLDVGVIRATTADTDGNLTMENETVLTGSLAIAQAAKANGGIVIAEVERVAQAGTLDPRRVKVPWFMVDAVVVADEGNRNQSWSVKYNPAFCGDLKVPVDSIPSMAMNERKIIARRAAMELIPGSTVNLGIGLPEGVSSVAAEEGFADAVILTVEGGAIGGVPAGGASFGASINPVAMITQSEQFDYYDGCGVDFTFLGMAQADSYGNVNVSKVGSRIVGSGGFVNISQNAKRACFCGTLTAGGLEVAVEGGKLKIVREGRSKKIVSQVEQITFSGKYAAKVRQPVLYVTERAVFRLTEEGLVLEEIAPGIELKTQVLDQIEAKVIVSPNLKEMDQRIFVDAPMGIAPEILEKSGK
ncbi:MAG: CoA-transferase [Negativicutes bacterium]|nr:CoA-transferase [Negativicutes bacterium]